MLSRRFVSPGGPLRMASTLSGGRGFGMVLGIPIGIAGATAYWWSQPDEDMGDVRLKATSRALSELGPSAMVMVAGPVGDLAYAENGWRTVRPWKKSENRPFKIYSGINMSAQSNVWTSTTVDAVVDHGLSRSIDGLENVTFGDVVKAIVAEGYEVYAYGGFLRDFFHSGEEADDIDILFTMPIEELRDMCVERGWRHYLKRDEETGKERFDFIAIGDKDAKGKFSGHMLDANCSGEFRMNCILYEVGSQLIIDASGRGIAAALRHTLSSPYDRVKWEEWAKSCDRLPGMLNLRYFNFRSRGYDTTDDLRTFMVERLVRLQNEGNLGTTLQTFKKRKLKTKEKVANYKRQFVADYNVVNGSGGEQWYKTSMAPIFDA